MGQGPEELRAQIEQTRNQLGQDADALADKVSPKAVAGRQWEKVSAAPTKLKERVMGSSGSSSGGAMGTMSDKASALGTSVSDRASSLTESAHHLPDTGRQTVSGSPLAAGGVAFALGFLIAGLIPASSKETAAAGRAVDKTSGMTDSLKEQLKTTATEVAQELKEPAKEAAASVQEKATGAAQEVKETGMSDASAVRGNLGS